MSVGGSLRIEEVIEVILLSWSQALLTFDHNNLVSIECILNYFEVFLSEVGEFDIAEFCSKVDLTVGDLEGMDSNSTSAFCDCHFEIVVFPMIAKCTSGSYEYRTD